MPRRARGGKYPKIAIYVTPVQQKQIADAARALDMSVSELVRRATTEWIQATFDSRHVEGLKAPASPEEVVEFFGNRAKRVVAEALAAARRLSDGSEGYL